MHKILYIFIASSALLLAACGGGGSGGGSSNALTAQPSSPTPTSPAPTRPPPRITAGAGTVSGTVRDANQNPQSAVHVRAVLTDDNRVQAGKFTDSSGKYQIKGLPPGNYQIIVENIDGRNNVTRQRISSSLVAATPVFPDEFYSGTNETSSDDPALAQNITVFDQQTTANIDFILNSSGGIANNTVIGVKNSTPISVGNIVSGTLGEATDFTDDLGLGYFIDAYSLPGVPGQSLSISLDSATFDTVVIVTSPDGTTFSDDDSGTGTNSFLNLSIDQSGPYLIIVTSYDPGQKGGYTLGLADTGNITILPIAIGDTLGGSLQNGDPVAGGFFMDFYEFNGTVGTPITLSLTSTQFDAYVLLMAPSGAISTNDDANAATTDAQLNGTLLESGIYTIGVSSFNPGESGNYDLSLTSP